MGVTTQEVADVICRSRSGMFARRDNLREVQEYTERFSGGEYIIAATVFHMTLNTLAHMFEEAEGSDFQQAKMREALETIAKWDPAASSAEPAGMSIMDAIDLARAALLPSEGGRSERSRTYQLTVDGKPRR